MQQRTISITSNLNSSFVTYYDSLTLYDGDSNSAPMIGEYCGNSIPNNQISSTNSVLIHFLSDGYDENNSGFQLQYQNPFPGKQRIIAKFTCWNHLVFDVWQLD